MTVFICDDNQEYLDQCSETLIGISKRNKLDITISCFTSGEEMMFYLYESPNKADIIYLDILMGKLNGLDLSKTLRQIGCQSEIIFLTTSEDFVYLAYDVSPVQYLLKSKTSLERFEEVLMRAIRIVEKKEKDIFICESNGVKKLIPFHQISFFEIWKRVVTIHYSSDESFQFYSSMELLEEQVAGKGFVRTHRSYMVNLTYVSQFNQTKLVLKTGDTIPIGVTYAEKLSKQFSHYIDSASIYY